MRERTLLKVIAVALTGLLVMQILFFSKEYKNQASASEYFEAPLISSVEPTNDIESDEEDCYEEVSNLLTGEEPAFEDDRRDELELNELSGGEENHFREGILEDVNLAYEVPSEMGADDYDDQAEGDSLFQETINLPLDNTDDNKESASLNVMIVVIECPHVTGEESKASVIRIIDQTTVEEVDFVGEETDEIQANLRKDDPLEREEYIIVIPNKTIGKESIDDEAIQIFKIKDSESEDIVPVECEFKGEMAMIFDAIRTAVLESNTSDNGEPSTPSNGEE